MRVTVEGNVPGEIVAKLPEIVRELLRMDATAVGDAPLAKSVDAAPDQEPRFTNPVALEMFRRSMAVAAARRAEMRRDVGEVLSR